MTNVPRISPVTDGGHRPLWSVMIPTYNCADYLRLTLASVLQQDPGPEIMHIEVVDDCSTRDDPETVVNEMGRGRVQFYRQPHNVGAIANFNTCVQRSTGQLVHLLHGDDLAAVGFYRRLEGPLLKNDELGAACCRQIFIDEAGKPQVMTRLEQPQAGVWANALAVLAVSNRIQPPAMVIKRSVYEALGGYNPALFHSADWEMWVRIAARYPIWFEPQALAHYRVHRASDTSRLVQTGANIQNRRACIATFQAYLPPARKKWLTRKAMGYAALYSLKLSLQFLISRRPQLAWVQGREAATCAGQALFSPDAIQ